MSSRYFSNAKKLQRGKPPLTGLNVEQSDEDDEEDEEDDETFMDLSEMLSAGQKTNKKHLKSY